MLEGINSLINLLENIVSFLLDTINSLINLVSNIPTYSAFLISSVQVLPSFIIPFAIAAVMIFIVLFVLGR